MDFSNVSAAAEDGAVLELKDPAGELILKDDGSPVTYLLHGHGGYTMENFFLFHYAGQLSLDKISMGGVKPTKVQALHKRFLGFDSHQPSVIDALLHGVLERFAFTN